MKYVSTRGETPGFGFSDVLLAGLARDGGLYLPETYPRFDADKIAGFAGQTYEDVAEAVISPYVGGDIQADALRQMIDDAYGTFRHPAVTPIVQLDDNLFVLELFHGPTLAFKDVAMQLLGRMMEHVLTARGRRATIVGATSGDTGGAAIEAFRGLKAVDIFILFPDGRVSDVQRRQMTTVEDDNVHALAVDGTFDDCQAIVKGLFNNHRFRDEVGLSGVNSINWGRIVAQTVYYFTAAVVFGAPHRAANFIVPTGNFGDILAGYVAKRMGLPIGRLGIATNINDILVRVLQTGRYEVDGVVPTTSPSMDIQVSSNFERLLFEAHDRDAAAVRGLMNGLAQSNGFSIEDGPLAAIRRDFDAARADEAETAATIAETYKTSGYLLDPHTAIGVAAARKMESLESGPQVVLGTAHPAKFPDAVKAASGQRPCLPEHAAHILSRPERMERVKADQAAVETVIRQSVREMIA